MARNCDFLIVGGGVIGLGVARELRREFPSATIAVIEKESRPGYHASGRNSGVIHAGFYYTADSLKARFTREGSALLHAYCEERKVPLNRCGKLVVAKDESEFGQLAILLDRARANGVRLETLTLKEAREIEPRLKAFGDKALWSQTTSSVDPLQVLEHFEKEARASGTEIFYDTAFLDRHDQSIITTTETFNPGYVVNCAGLYADKVAKAFGFSGQYAILPFKGYYLYSSEPHGALRTNVYPVPDLQNPFLGVHFTVTVAGQVKIGPTAIPALWREQYGFFERFKPAEFAEIALRQTSLLFHSSFDFRALAWREITKSSALQMAKLASALVEGVSPSHFKIWGKPGIRAQLMHVKKRKLEMDFIVEGDERSYHVLNSVSPAFTCSIPLSQYIVSDIRERMR